MIEARYAGWSVGLLMYLAGILSTIAGSWVASKIGMYHDNRRLHHDDLKQKVLIPLCDGLQSHYAPLVRHSSEVVSENWGPLVRSEHAKVTESTVVQGPRVQAKDPGTLLESTMDAVLLEDARQNHYEELVAAWDVFKTSWTDYAKRFEDWVTAMSLQILDCSQLLAHPASSPGPYAMACRLAVFVYMRLFGLPTDALRKEMQTEGRWFLVGVGTLASGNEGQIDRLVGVLDNLVDSEQNKAETLRRESQGLQLKLDSLSQKLSLAIAERGLRGRCSMVTFFR
jgi:hypothetical protein